MNYTTLPNTDLRVSTQALGCFAFAGGQTWGEQDEQDSISTLEEALELGITFFDTAEGYGAGYSEELVGRVLASRRDKVVIATKASRQNLAPNDLEAACEASLRRLQTDYIDLYQIHWPNHDVPIADTVGKLEELKKKGMVRAIGVSNFGVGDMTDYLKQGTPVTNQLPYNLLFRPIEHKVIPLCHEHSVSILPYSPLMQGMLTGKFNSPDDVPEGRARTRHFSGNRPQASHGEPGAEKETFGAIDEMTEVAKRIGQPLTYVALAWLLAQADVHSVLVGARNVEQLRNNVKAAEVSLSQEDVDALSATTADLKQKLGANPDMWNGAENSRYR